MVKSMKLLLINKYFIYLFIRLFINLLIFINIMSYKTLDEDDKQKLIEYLQIDHYDKIIQDIYLLYPKKLNNYVYESNIYNIPLNTKIMYISKTNNYLKKAILLDIKHKTIIKVYNPYKNIIYYIYCNKYHLFYTDYKKQKKDKLAYDLYQKYLVLSTQKK